MCIMWMCNAVEGTSLWESTRRLGLCEAFIRAYASVCMSAQRLMSLGFNPDVALFSSMSLTHYKTSQGALVSVRMP